MGWTVKYLFPFIQGFRKPDVLPKKIQEIYTNPFDFIPEEVFFSKGAEWKSYFDWNKTPTHYGVIKLTQPWEKEITGGSSNRKKMQKYTHALTLNGVPFSVLSTFTSDGDRNWEQSDFDSMPWEVRERLVEEFEEQIDTIPYDELVKGGIYRKWVQEQNERYNSTEMVPKTNLWFSKLERILKRMQSLTEDKFQAETFGYPNRFYQQVMNPHQYPVDSMYGSWLSTTTQEEKEKKYEELKEEDRGLRPFYGVLAFCEDSLARISSHVYLHSSYANGPTIWKNRIFKLLNELSKREWIRGSNSMGCLNHSTLSKAPIYRVDEALKVIGATEPKKKNPLTYELQSHTLMGIRYGENWVKTTYPYSTGDFWAGMLLNGLNFYVQDSRDNDVKAWAFTEQCLTIRRHIPWNTWHPIWNNNVMDYANPPMVEKADIYPLGATNPIVGVLPPFVVRP